MKSFKKFFVAFSVLGLAITGCSSDLGSLKNDKRYEAYHLAVADGYEGTYEQWLETIRGKDGADGKTPYIGENGNWFIGDIDTGVKAQGDIGPKGAQGEIGQNGQQGEKGDKGESGKDGTSVLTGSGTPTSSLGQNGDSYIDTDTWDYYLKSNDIWVRIGNIKGEQGAQGEKGETGVSGADGVNGKDGINGVDGRDGVSVVSITKTATNGLVDTYTIIYSDGTTSTFSVTNGQNGEQGIQGEPGQDGHTPTISIGQNGHWYIDGEDTGVNAQGEKGENGKNGTSILTGSGIPLNETGQNGDSYINIETWDYYVKLNDIWVKLGNVKGEAGQNGTDGQDGQNGSSLLTGNGEPLSTTGQNGDSYVDMTTWNYYLKINGCWVKEGNIKGTNGQNGVDGKDGVSVISISKTSSNGLADTYTITYSDGATSTFTVTNGQNGEQGIQGEPGQDGHTPTISIGQNGHWYIDGNDSGISAQGEKGNDGVSIVSAVINDDGDLIVTFSDWTQINAGKVKDTDECIVNFYCDDLLIETQHVAKGEKATKPTSDEFIITGWYVDKELTESWVFYGYVVTEDMNLYADYTAKPKQLSFNNTNSIQVDNYGYGETLENSKEICVSKGVETNDYLTTLENRGILFNKEEIGNIGEMTITIDNNNFSSAKIYYGDTPLAFDNSEDLSAGENHINLNNAQYFTIQNEGTESINVESLSLSYKTKTIYANDDIPSVIINTADNAEITSRIEYVDCSVSTNGAVKDVNNLSGKIKLRGNSTSGCPKKPYRIKLDKKNSLFGYTKAKNWALLADYMDGSNMHNYTALSFAKMLRGENSFGVNPLHVEVILNGVNVGLYLFCEHIDAKEGRIDIEQDRIWEKDFEDINFYIERDESTIDDALEVEGETFFQVNFDDYELDRYVFALKYPEKEDFEEELDDGTINYHEGEFQTFFNNLVNYITDVCERFRLYYHNQVNYDSVASVCDMESLALFDTVDQAFRETDHWWKSFKMYRRDGGLLNFGPNWDYDSCSYGLRFQGTYVLDPFGTGNQTHPSTYIGDTWGNVLFKDNINGRPLFENIWSNISEETINAFMVSQKEEMKRISKYSIYDCELWMNSQYYGLFDNQLYYYQWTSNQLTSLYSLYNS